MCVYICIQCAGVDNSIASSLTGLIINSNTKICLTKDILFVVACLFLIHNLKSLPNSCIGLIFGYVLYTIYPYTINKTLLCSIYGVFMLLVFMVRLCW